MDASRPPLLILATPDWDGDYMKSTVALTQELASSYRILYVEHAPTFTSLGRQAVQGAWRPTVDAMRRSRARVRSVRTTRGATVHVLTPPPVWPMNGLPPRLYDAVLRRNAAVVQRAVQPWLERLAMDTPVVLSALNPHYGKALAGAFDETGRIYYCYDEIRARRWNGRHGGRMEDAYLHQADAVIASSPALHGRLRQQHEAAYLVPNGVNFSLFNQAAQGRSRTDAPPCVGYLGSLDDRLDYQLLRRLIERHPAWRFRFVGRVVSPAAEALRAYPHVTLTGAQPPHTLPDALRRMDVGLIPFVRNDFTRHIYPLKANEYLAAGLPVVATAFADLSMLQEVVTIARNAASFLHAVETLIEEGDAPAQRPQRIAVAATNRWSARADAVQGIIERVRTRAPAKPSPAELASARP